MCTQVLLLLLLASLVFSADIKNNKAFTAVSEEPWEKLYRTVYETRDVVGYIINDRAIFRQLMALSTLQVFVPIFCRGIVKKEGIIHELYKGATIYDVSMRLLKNCDLFKLDECCAEYSCEQEVIEFLGKIKKHLKERSEQFSPFFKNPYHYFSIYKLSVKYLDDNALSYVQDMSVQCVDCSFSLFRDMMNEYIEFNVLDSGLSNLLENIFNGNSELHNTCRSILASLHTCTRQSIIKNVLQCFSDHESFFPGFFVPALLSIPEVSEAIKGMGNDRLNCFLESGGMSCDRSSNSSSSNSSAGSNSSTSNIGTPACNNTEPINLPPDLMGKIMFEDINLNNFKPIFYYMLVCHEWHDWVRNSSEVFLLGVPKSVQVGPFKFLLNFKITFPSCTPEAYISMVKNVICAGAMVIPEAFTTSQKLSIYHALSKDFTLRGNSRILSLMNEVLSTLWEEDEEANAKLFLKQVLNDNSLGSPADIEAGGKVCKLFMFVLLNQDNWSRAKHPKLYEYFLAQKETDIRGDKEDSALQLFCKNYSSLQEPEFRRSPKICFDYILQGISTGETKGIDLSNRGAPLYHLLKLGYPPKDFSAIFRTVFAHNASAPSTIVTLAEQLYCSYKKKREQLQ